MISSARLRVSSIFLTACKDEKGGRAYLAFFSLKKADPVEEQLEIFLGFFALQFRLDQLPVESCIVVFLIRIQVDLVVLVVGLVLELLLVLLVVLSDLVII